MRPGWLGGAVLASAAVAAADPTVSLEVRGSCAITEAVAGAHELIGYPAIVSGAKRALRVEVLEQQGAMRASLLVENPDGTTLGPRELSAATCASLQEPLAVVLATMIRTLPEDGQPFADHDVDDDPTGGAVTVTAARTPPDRHYALVLGSSVTSAEAIEVGGGLRFAWGSRSIGIALRDQFARTTEVMMNAVPVGTLRISRMTADLTPCVHRGAFAACGLLSAGRIDAGAIGLMDPRHVRSTTAAVGTRAEVEHRLSGGVGVRLHVDASASLTTTHLLMDDEIVWSSARFSLGFGIDVLAHIP